MILNWNQSLGEKDDKILRARRLKKHPEDEGWRGGRRKRQREVEGQKKMKENIDAFIYFPRNPFSRVGLFVVLSLLFVLFPASLPLDFITHSSAVPSLLSFYFQPLTLPQIISQ